MPGSATLGSNLVDSLVSVADALRSDLNPAAGVRQYRVYTVRRSWSGDCRGDGVATTTEIELLPQPKVEESQLVTEGFRYNLRPEGKTEEGSVTLREVSLTYTEAELTGGTIGKTVEWFYKLVDAQGQQIQPRYFVLSRPPIVDREKDIGWIVFLKRAEIA